MPVTGFEVLGAVSASYGLIDKVYNSLVHLRECWKHSKDVEGKLGELVKLAKEIKTVVENMKTKVNRRANELETSASDVIGVLQGKVDKNVEGATTALHKLDKYQESSAGLSSGLAKFRKQVRNSRIGLTVKMKFSKSITDALAKAELCLDKALQGASNIEMHRKLDEAICPPQTKEEKFVPYFDRPELPPNLVLDFGTTETQEGRLLQRLLGLQGEENVDGISAVGSSRGSAVHGMGGIGKTTALRALCYHEKVRKAFPDGIYFFELGQDANDSNVRNQLEQCVFNFGGVKVVAKMEKEPTLDEVVKHAARWLRETAVLFVCDDLWGSPTSSFGYLPLLKRLLRNAPGSKLLISTRDQRIAEEVSMSYETFGTLPPQGQSARNLLGQITFGAEHTERLKRTDIREYVETILKVCTGLQLALCMAGRTLRTAIERLGDVRMVFEDYSSQLERDQRPHEKGRSAQLYDHGLPHIVEASLVQCEQCAEKSLNNVNVRDLFYSLCVLEKHMVMPRSMLSNLWGISAQRTDHVVQKFADLGLISETKYKIPSETSENEATEDIGVRLHDMILVLCQEMADDVQERHGSVIDGLKRSKSVWIGEKYRQAMNGGA